MAETQCYNPTCRRPVQPWDDACPTCGALLWLRSRRYRVVRMLKATYLSTVYEATDRELAGRRCAIKCVEARSGGDLARMQNEVAILATAELPFIPAIYDRWAEGLMHCFTMEFIVGETLDEVRAGAWPVADAANMLEQLLSYLGLMHQVGIYHRDIKPSNILLASEGRHRGKFVLIDFNIAKNVGLNGDETHEWNRGHTRLYAAPEQISGGETDARSDLYSLGRTTYALLSPSGKPDDLFQLNCLPPAVDTTLRALLQPDPLRRPADAHAALALLRAGATAEHPWAAPSTAQQAPDPAAEETQLAPAPAQLSMAGGGRASDVAWHSDGGRNWLLVAATPGVYRYDPHDIREDAPWIELPGARQLALLPPGDRLAVAADRAAEILQLPNGKRLCQLEDAAELPDDALVFAPLWAAAVDRGMLRLWRLADGQQVSRIPIAASSYCLALSELLAAVASDHAIQIVRLADGAVIRSFSTPGQAGVAIRFAPGGAALALAYENRLAIVRMPGGETIAELPLACPIDALAFDELGARLAFAAGGIQLWRFETDQPPRTIDARPSRVEALAFEPGGALLAAVCDGAVQLYPLRRGSSFARLPMHGPGAECLAYAQAGRLVAAANGALTLYALGRAGQLARVSELAVGSPPLALACSPGGESLAVGSIDGVSIWRLPDFAPLAKLPTKVGEAHTLAFAGDGILVVAAPTGAERWRVADATLQGRQTLDIAGSDLLALAPDGAGLALCGGGRLRAWSSPGAAPWLDQRCGPRLNSLALAPGAAFLAVVGAAETQLWRVGDDEPASSAPYGGQNAAFSPDGALLATLDQNTIRVWRVGRGRLEPVCALEGHAGYVLDAVFLPGGQLASTALDGTLRVWEYNPEGGGHE